MAAKRKKAKKAIKRKSTRGKRIPAEQGKSEVGYGKPPEEHQFKPGESGNPKGPPIHRTNLWVWFCKYMNMTNAELAKLKQGRLSQAQQTALKLVRNMTAGKDSGSERLARHVFDREQGKATEHLVIESENALTDEECDDISLLQIILCAKWSQNIDVSIKNPLTPKLG